MIVRAVVGWGGKGVRGDTDRIGARSSLVGHPHQRPRQPVRPRADRRRPAGAGRRARRPRLRPLRVRVGPRAGVLLPEVRHAAPSRLSAARPTRDADLRLHLLQNGHRFEVIHGVNADGPTRLPDLRRERRSDKAFVGAGDPFQGHAAGRRRIAARRPGRPPRTQREGSSTATAGRPPTAARAPDRAPTADSGTARADGSSPATAHRRGTVRPASSDSATDHRALDRRPAGSSAATEWPAPRPTGSASPRRPRSSRPPTSRSSRRRSAAGPAPASSRASSSAGGGSSAGARSRRSSPRRGASGPSDLQPGLFEEIRG